MNENTFTKVYQETEKILIELITQIKIYSEYEQNNKIELLEAEKIKLQNRDLVIAVIGTMKAGKSTTINAIVGQEILPHRIEAMTTLPTLVTHKKNQTTPILHFDKYNIIQDFIVEVKEKLKSDTKIGEKFKTLADDIKNDKLNLQDTCEGKENIFKFLKDVNELMRFASDIGIEPPYKYFQNTNDFPRIEVEFYYLKDNEELFNSKFTLMDTPGPNESKNSKYLEKISKKQTESASAVILAIDYPQISGESSANIKEQVNNALEYIGEDKVCIFLNKFDEDRKQTNPKGYKGAIYDFGKEFLGKNFVEDRVFPVSSRDAFFANLGLNEIEVNGKIDTELPWCKEFGVNILGDLWEEDIEDKSRVNKMCQIKYEKSYFDEAMKMVIHNSYENSKLDVIVSALTTMEGISREFNNELDSTLNNLTKKIDSLKTEIEKTIKDMKVIKDVSIEINKSSKSEIERISEIINKTLESKLDEFNKNITESINKTNDELKQKAKRKDSNKVEEEHNKKWNFFGFQLNKKRLNKKEKEQFEKIEKKFNELKEKKEIIFDNNNDKENFIKNIESEVNEILTTFQNESYYEIEKEINQFIPQLNSSVQNKLENIIKNIENSFGKDINFIIPKIIFDDFQRNENIDIESIVKDKKIEKTRRKNKDTILGAFLRKIDFFDMNLGTSEEKYYENNSEITKEDFVKTINSAIINLKNSVEKEIEKEFKNKVINPIHKEISKLNEEIKSLSFIKKDFIKKREANEIDIEKSVSLAKEGIKHLVKTTRRLKNTRRIINKG